jgi:hypothetical protein
MKIQNKQDKIKMMKDQISKLLSKPMDRKEFLKHVGIGFAILVGLSGVIKAFKSQSVAGRGYGASVYGGNKDVAQL